MSQGPLCPNLTKKGQAEVSQMANRNLSRVILLGGLSVNLNHLKTVYKTYCFGNILAFQKYFSVSEKKLHHGIDFHLVFQV